MLEYDSLFFSLNPRAFGYTCLMCHFVFCFFVFTLDWHLSIYLLSFVRLINIIKEGITHSSLGILQRLVYHFMQI